MAKKVIIRKEVHYAEGVMKELNLEEHTMYHARIKCSGTNPMHDTVLFTGFKNGNYCTCYTSASDPTAVSDLHTIQVMKKIGKIPGYPKNQK